MVQPRCAAQAFLRKKQSFFSPYVNPKIYPPYSTVSLRNPKITPIVQVYDSERSHCSKHDTGTSPISNYFQPYFQLDQSNFTTIFSAGRLTDGCYLSLQNFVVWYLSGDFPNTFDFSTVSLNLPLLSLSTSLHKNGSKNPAWLPDESTSSSTID